MTAPTPSTMHPARKNVVILSFEGPDQYSLIGGLATRVTELAQALGDDGSDVTLLFVGDPHAAAVERVHERVEYRRWSQWLSAHHPANVYDGEPQKIVDFTRSVPPFVTDEIVRAAIGRGEHVTVLAEEWQTVQAVLVLDRMLREHGLRERVTILWNANNTYGFDAIDWTALTRAARITTVSKYMKFELALFGVEALVIPNGIPDRLAETGPQDRLIAQLAAALPGQWLLKVGRYDVDKRWLQAIDAYARIRASGFAPRMILRGGRESYGEVVRERIRSYGLLFDEIRSDSRDDDALIPLLAQSEADVIEIRSFVPERLLHALYGFAAITLANSGKEPFGLVGLEVMACGGVPVCGSTGEEYAEPFINAIVCDTSDGAELAAYLRRALDDQAALHAMADAALETVKRYTWSRVLAVLDQKLAYVAAST